MTYASGSFYTGGVVSEVSTGADTTANTWGVQLNTNYIPFGKTPDCKNGGAKCQGWQQFEFRTLPGNTFAFIEYWLLNYTASNGTSGCPTDAHWQYFRATSTTLGGCRATSKSISIPAISITDLSKLTLEASIAADGTHQLVVGTGDNSYVLGALSLVGLTGNWTQAEFNIVGYQTIISSTGVAQIDAANLNPGAVVSVDLKVTGNPGALGDISCIVGGTTAETNNLTLNILNVGYPTLSSCDAGYWDGWDQIAFSESTAPVIGSVNPPSGPVAGAVTVNVNGTGFIPDTQANGSVSNGTGILVDGKGPYGQCDSSTHCSFITPRANGPTISSVTAFNYTSLASSIVSNPVAYRYIVYPEGAISPSEGPTSGGTALQLSGNDLSTTPGGTQIDFQFTTGSTPAQNVSCTSAPAPASSQQVCSFTDPPLSPAGPGPTEVPVTVTVGGLTAPVGAFTYGPHPVGPPLPTCHCNGLKCCPTGTPGQFFCILPTKQCGSLH